MWERAMPRIALLVALLLVVTASVADAQVVRRNRTPPSRPPPSPPPPSTITPPSPPPPSTITPAITTTTVIPPSPYADPLLPPICPSAGGGAYSVDSYPGTPNVITPFVDAYTEPPVLQSAGRACRTAPDRHCVLSYGELNVTDFQARPFDNAIPACKAQPSTWFMGYGSRSPGPTIVVPVGHESLIRFTNKISTARFTADAPCSTTAGRSGRPLSIHHHGSASLAPFDGWAEDVICGGESKDYIYPNSRPGTGWYHDHALHETTVNVYNGLVGSYLASAKLKHGGCGEPWNLENMDERLFMLADKVLDSTCQSFVDRNGPHKDDIYGDINTVNGVPFPAMSLDAKWYRMRFINAAGSRPFLLKIKDAAGIDVSSKVCQVIAKDGGFRQTPVAFPIAGLFMSVAERYEIVCDFSSQTGKTLWLWNERDTPFMKTEVPYFCFSHLIAKITVTGLKPGSPVFNPTPAINGDLVPLTKVLNQTEINAAVAMANAGQFHRDFDFGRTGGQWSINGETWDTAKIAAADVGQNTWEVWHFSSGGGWFHPIHVHLVDMYILKRVGAGDVRPAELWSPSDVVHLAPGSELFLLVRFGAHKGDYMFHCHNLVHEDNDMMRAFRITNTTAGRIDRRSTADRFVRNPLYGVVYGNFKYSDPMLADAKAQPTAAMPTLAAKLTSALSSNLYRIFYPTLADKTAYSGFSNPWGVQVCPV